MKNLKEHIVDNDEILDVVDKIVEDDRTIEGLKKDYPIEIKSLEEGLHKKKGENDLKILKTGFPDKMKFLTKKLAYPNKYFDSIDGYQKPVDNFKKEDFFNELKNKFPGDKEIERTKEIIERIDIKNGEELTKI